MEYLEFLKHVCCTLMFSVACCGFVNVFNTVSDISDKGYITDLETNIKPNFDKGVLSPSETNEELSSILDLSCNNSYSLPAKIILDKRSSWRPVETSRRNWLLRKVCRENWCLNLSR